MAHKTKIDGTAYNVVGGTTLINGTGYNIAQGNTVIDGTGFIVPFQKKIQRLAFKGYRYDNGYTKAPSETTGYGTTSIYPSDFGLEDFSRVESMYCWGIDDHWTGSYNTNTGKWSYSLNTYNSYVNPYPTDALPAICFCDENRTINKQISQSGNMYRQYIDYDTVNECLKVTNNAKSPSSYGNSHTPYLRRVDVTYWEDVPEGTPVTNDPVIKNRTQTYNFDGANRVYWYQIGIDTYNKGFPYGVYKMYVTFLRDGVEDTAYVAFDTSTAYTDFWNKTTKTQTCLWWNNSGFEIRNSASTSSYTTFQITKILVYYSV